MIMMLFKYDPNASPFLRSERRRRDLRRSGEEHFSGTSFTQSGQSSKECTYERKKER